MAKHSIAAHSLTCRARNKALRTIRERQKCCARQPRRQNNVGKSTARAGAQEFRQLRRAPLHNWETQEGCVRAAEDRGLDSGYLDKICRAR